MTDNQLTRLDKWFKTMKKLSEMDNKQLAWVFIKLFDTDDDSLSEKSLIIDEIVDRLYPEYDGDIIEITSTGWNTPDGPIDYINSDA